MARAPHKPFFFLILSALAVQVYNTGGSIFKLLRIGRYVTSTVVPSQRLIHMHVCRILERSSASKTRHDGMAVAFDPASILYAFSSQTGISHYLHVCVGLIRYIPADGPEFGHHRTRRSCLSKQWSPALVQLILLPPSRHCISWTGPVTMQSCRIQSAGTLYDTATIVPSAKQPV